MAEQAKTGKTRTETFFDPETGESRGVTIEDDATPRAGVSELYPVERHKVASYDDERLIQEESWNGLNEANDPVRFVSISGVPHEAITMPGQPTSLVRWESKEQVRERLTKFLFFYSWLTPFESKANKKEREDKHLPPLEPYRQVRGVPDFLPTNLIQDPYNPLPVVERVVSTPVFGKDWQMETAPGYHATTRTFYAAPVGLDIPAVSKAPSADEMAKALGAFDELVRDFPFVSPADKSHSLALMLLPFLRDGIDGPTPLHLIGANVAGTGKGKLANVLLMAAVGPGAEKDAV